MNTLESTRTETDREIVIARVFDAPPELVFKAFTDPQHVAQWWGPSGFTITIRQMDVRPGGIWRLVMHGPDGRDYHNRIVYLEIDRPKRLVFKHEPDADCEPVGHQTTVTFDKQGDQTKVTMRMRFADAADAITSLKSTEPLRVGTKRSSGWRNIYRKWPRPNIFPKAKGPSAGHDHADARCAAGTGL